MEGAFGNVLGPYAAVEQGRLKNGEIKITTLTDKIKDEEILSRLKGIGVKIKDKEKETGGAGGQKKTSTASGETVIEKRVASTVIRRRVQTPPAEVKEAVKEPEPEVEEAAQAEKEGQVSAKAAPERRAPKSRSSRWSSRRSRRKPQAARR